MTTTPRRLGKYELRQLLGHGSAGEVWKGYDLQRRQDVAVKLLHPDLLQSDPNFINLFLKEWQFIIALHHPNIVQVHDASVTRSNETRVTTPYIVMDYIEGHTTLADVIQRTSRVGKFPAVADIVHIFSRVGAAVDYAHEQQIFHDDIKPTNILLDTHTTDTTDQWTYGEPVLTDFGIARLPINEATLSPLYMSPEQVIGRPSNSRSDIYALGVILYEMCTGVLPFHGESNVAIMMHHINTLPTPPMLINQNIPPELSEVILRAMAKDPNARFATASVLASALAEACAIAQDPHLLNKKAQTAEGTGATGEVPLFYMSSGPLPITSNLGEQTASNVNLPPILGVAQPAQGMGIQGGQERQERQGGQRTQGTSAKIPAAQVQRTMFPLDEKAVVPNSPLSSTRQVPRISSQSLPPVPSSVKSDTLVPHYPFSTGQLSGTGKVHTPPAIPMTPGSARARQGKKSSSSPFLSPLALIIICLLLLLAVVGSLVTSQLLHRAALTTPKVVGHVFLQDDALGRDDTLRIEMQGVAAPAQGKQYFAWLQQSTGQVIPLGSLPFQNGSASLLYTGNSQHSNLLATMQAVIVTLETDGSSTPAFHSDAKVYQASFAATMLPYIQHILYSLPGFPARGGLSAGLFDTVQGMNDKAASIVDSLRGKPADDALAIRQATRIIELIDGTQFAQSSGDLPQALPSMLTLPVGLISSATQQGYIDALAAQIDKLKQVAGDNTDLLRHIQNVENALTDLQNWVVKMRTYDVQILSATNLNDPAIINVALQLRQLVQDAYTGRVVPPNDSPLPILGSAGATQAYAECQYLAALDIR